MHPKRSLASGVRRGSLSGLLAFVLITVSAFAADPLRTFNSRQDLWVASPSLKGTTGNLQLGGASGKEIYLRFHVDETAGTGSPFSTAGVNGTHAQLKLYQTVGVGDTGTITVYAANNRASGATADWTETSMTWANQTGINDSLDTATSRTTAGDVVFDLADYISGPGDYSFHLVITGSAAEHSFGSKDASIAAQKPRLEFKVEGDVIGPVNVLDPQSPYYLRDPSDISLLGDIYRTRYELSNPGAAATAEVEDIGYFDVTKQPYGAKPNDSTYDSTWGIQRAVNEARDARVALYFPPGTYYVSRTIEMAQGSTSNPPETIAGLRWTVREFPCVLLGDRGGTRPKIKIMSSSTFFDQATDPQPVLHFWSRHGSFTIDPNTQLPDPSGYTSPEANHPGTHYYQWLDNIDLDLSSKAGAVGVDMDGAQGTNFTNSTITATGAYAGFMGGTGPGGYAYGILVNGGTYGAYFAGAHCPLIVNSMFTDQSNSALYHGGRGPLTLVGVQIDSSVTQTGPRIMLDAPNNNPWMAAFNAIDSSIQGTGLLIQTDRSISLTNTYLKNGSSTATAIQQTDPVGGSVSNFALGTTNWKILSQYARGVKIVQQIYPAADEPGDTDRVRYWIDGIKNTTDNAYLVNGGTATALPTDLQFGANNRHFLPDTPQFTAVDNASVVNAKTTTAGGTTAGVITAAKLNTLVSAVGSKAIFIPRGEYVLTSTVTFTANTKLFGVGPTISVLRADPALATPMLKSGTSVASTALLADLKLLLPLSSNGTASMLLWRAGENSTVKNVGFDDRWSDTSNPRTVPLIKIVGPANTDPDGTGNGGGKWAGVWLLEGKNADHASGASYLQVLGTNEPLRFYMLNLEHSAASPQAKFINASNFDIFQSKAESQLTADTNPDNEHYWFDSCDSFRAFGFGGTGRPETGKTTIRLVGNANDNYMITQVQFQQVTSGDPDPNGFWRIIDNNVNKVRGDQQTVLYQRGSPPNN